MNYTFSLEQGGVFSAECFSDIPVSVLLKLKITPDKCCSNDSEMESCQGSQSGTILKPLMERRGNGQVPAVAELAWDILITPNPKGKNNDARANRTGQGYRQNDR